MVRDIILGNASQSIQPVSTDLFILSRSNCLRNIKNSNSVEEVIPWDTTRENSSGGILWDSCLRLWRGTRFDAAMQSTCAQINGISLRDSYRPSEVMERDWIKLVDWFMKSNHNRSVSLSIYQNKNTPCKINPSHELYMGNSIKSKRSVINVELMNPASVVFYWLIKFNTIHVKR